MTIQGKELTPDQERRYKEIWEQFAEEVKRIPPWPERAKKQGLGLLFNSKEADRPYRELEHKYLTLIDAIIEEAPCAGGDPHT